ncbi:MAG: acyl-ACP--UDP-N-acetylglucosamine O-acyltransferase [candidate division WOR-3 bacterium]
MIHPTAVVDPSVEFGPGVEVGPFCRLQGRVSVGAGTRLMTGVVIGGEPMDRRYAGEETGVAIGCNNTFYEYATVHRSTGAGTLTRIGDANCIMAYVHIAHNCRVGSNCTLTNGVQLAGHVEVGDGATIGGLTGVHQFCRIGELAMVGACSYVNKDVPPFMLAAGNPCRVFGVNTVGLSRAGKTAETVAGLKSAFRLLYRSGFNLAQALARIESERLVEIAEVARLTEFCCVAGRGIELRCGQAVSADE